MHTYQRTKLVAGALALALVVAACGSDDDGGGDAGATTTAAGGAATTAAGGAATTAAGGGGTGVEGAKAFLADYMANPTELPLTTPLSKKPEAGKKIVTCESPQPVTIVKDEAIAEAAEVLGWEYTRIPFGTGAEDAGRCMRQALDMNPDGIHTSPGPRAVIEQQIAEAQAAGIPVIIDSNTDPTGDGIINGVLDGPAQVEQWGRMIGAFIVADSEGDANTLLFNIPDAPILLSFEKGLKDAIAEWCESCEVEVVNQQFADLGTNIPTNVVSALQRNPDANYLAFAFGDMTLGVEAALQGANLADKVKVVGETPSAANLQALRDGTEAGWAGFSAPVLGWLVIDAFARHFNGDAQIEDEQVFLPTQMLTPETIEGAVLEDDYYIGLADYREQFEALWQVG